MQTVSSLKWVFNWPQITMLVLVIAVTALAILSISLLKLLGKETKDLTPAKDKFWVSVLYNGLYWALVYFAGCFQKDGNWALVVMAVFTITGLLASALNNGKQSGISIFTVNFVVRLQFYGQLMLFLAGFYTSTLPIAW